MDDKPVDVLNVYIALWYQYHCLDMTRSKRIKRHLDPLELNNMLNYWHRVVSFDAEWLHKLSWPQCWYEVATGGNSASVVNIFQDWSTNAPNFSGNVDLQELRHETMLTYLPRSAQSLTFQFGGALSDSGFQYLSHLTFLDINSRMDEKITDFGFQHLSNLKSLVMCHCRQTAITDSAFRHLANLTSLNIGGCKQTTITDSAFNHLSKLRSINMEWCHQLTVTDAAFQHLSTAHHDVL